MRLLLFDIDGTLIHTSGAGRAALAQALEQVFGHTGPIKSYPFAGKTDARIITDLMTAAGVPSKALQQYIPDVYAQLVFWAYNHFRDHEIKPIMGVQAVLAGLTDRPDVVTGLLTGNSRQIAPLKLAAAGLDPLFFKVGAYGSDDRDRNRLPALAFQRAHEVTGFHFTGQDAMIIGDTPADILCARAGQATAIAVATGQHSRAQLEKHQPDALLDDWSDTERIVELLLNRD